MPRLACFSCGRTIWATVPLDELFADERRCPRCGASLLPDRRLVGERRVYARRQRVAELAASAVERRGSERRLNDRRRRRV